MSLFLTAQEHYGKSDQSSVARVKTVYRELELEALFLKYEQESHQRLINRIQGQMLLPKEVFTLLLNKIYKRQK